MSATELCVLPWIHIRKKNWMGKQQNVFKFQEKVKTSEYNDALLDEYL